MEMFFLIAGPPTALFCKGLENNLEAGEHINKDN